MQANESRTLCVGQVVLFAELLHGCIVQMGPPALLAVLTSQAHLVVHVHMDMNTAQVAEMQLGFGLDTAVYSVTQRLQDSVHESYKAEGRYTLDSVGFERQQLVRGMTLVHVLVELSDHDRYAHMVVDFEEGRAREVLDEWVVLHQHVRDSIAPPANSINYTTNVTLA